MSLLPFDETGSLATNLKTEQHSIVSANGIDHAFIVPQWAPFFKSGFAIFHVESGKFLNEGEDFEFTHDFQEAYERLSRHVYGSITLLNPNLVGTFQLQFQSLGGDFVTPTTQAIENGFDALLSLQTTTWDNVVSIETFPPTMHEIPLSDIEGVTEIINQLALMRSALDAGVSDIRFEDIRDLDTQFTVPLMEKLEDIALAIREKEYSNNLYYEEALIKEEIREVPFTPNTWTQIPLVLTLAVSGSFIIDWDVLGKIDTGDGQVQYRWTSNGSVVSKSYNKNIVSTHGAGTVLRLEMRVVESTGTKVALSSLVQGAVFRATRIGN